MRPLLLCCFLICSLPAIVQTPVDFSDFNKSGAATANVLNNILEVTWPISEVETGKLMINLERENSHFGGHWMNIFPKPVYWIMSRETSQPFVEEDAEYGKVYRVGNKEEMLELLEVEKGLAWTAHARTKGSTGFPGEDQYEGYPGFWKRQLYLSREPQRKILDKGGSLGRCSQWCFYPICMA